MTVQKIGFYCKTFKPDFDHLVILLDSYVRHNPDNLELTLSLPRGDVADFKNRFGMAIPNLRLVCDEDYCEFDLSRIPGWYGQQLCKLLSWRVTDADHYAVLDSDCYFIRDVFTEDLAPQNGKDFIIYGSAIRTVLSPENNNETLFCYLKDEAFPTTIFPPIRPAPTVDFTELKSHQNSSVEDLSLAERSGLIFRLFHASKWYFYQPGQLFSSAILRALKDFFAENALTLAEAISIAPWEYNWYGEYAAAFYSARTDFRVSPMLHFASEESVVMAIQKGMTEEVLADKFTWIQMAARHHGVLRLSPNTGPSNGQQTPQ